jgi:Glycosyltransferase family 87
MRWTDRPLSLAASLGVVGAALAVLVVAFGVATRPADSIAGSDVTIYERYGSKMLDGAVPYRDFRMEYPPAASVMFALPATRLFAGGSTDGASWAPLNASARRYYRGFTSLVVLLMGAIVILTALTLRALRRPAGTVLVSLAIVALSPLLLGELLPERFDVWPAALTAAALAAGAYEHYRLGGAFVGIGAAAKIYPALLLPVLALVALRQRGVREALAVAGTSIAVAAAVFLPFAVMDPAGTWESVRSQFPGGLQIESLASSVLVTVGDGAFTTHGAGGGLIRIDLGGPGVGATTILMNVLLAAALCLLWVGLLRSRRDAREDLVRLAAGAVATLLVLGTVLSPQYLIWLIPLVPLVGGRRGTAAALLFVVAAALTNVWIPDRYFEYQGELSPESAALLLVRNVTLLALALVLLIPNDAVRHLLGGTNCNGRTNSPRADG